MFRLIIACLVFVAVGAHNFTNPLVDKGSDPWMVYYKDYYYLLVSPWSNSIRMRKAATLSELYTAENVEILSFNGTSGWAPEIHQVDGKWYLYFCACLGADISNICHKIHVAESAGDNPMGPYTFKATFVTPNNSQHAEIDPSLIKIKGQNYLIGSSNYHLYIRKLVTPTQAEGPVHYISKPIYDWEMPNNEGPEPLYNGDRVFIVYSANSCSTANYQLGLIEYVGTDPLNYDHWKKYPKPVFVRDDAINVYGPGHNGFFMSPDGKENWIIYHANSKLNGQCDGNRNPRAKKFIFGSDGLPFFGKPNPTGVSLEGPSGEP